MKDVKKQKAKTYERRKNRTKNEYVRKENIRQQIRAVDNEIEAFKLKFINRKFDLGIKVGSSVLMGFVGSLLPVAIFCPDSETLSELINDFSQKSVEEPLIATTPILSALTFVLALNFYMNKLGTGKLSEINDAFRYNKSLLNKKSELEAKLERKSYIDADKARTKSKTKTYKK